MRIRDTRAKRDDRNASSLAVRLVDFTASREGGLIYHRRIIYHRKRQSSLSLSLSLPPRFPSNLHTPPWKLSAGCLPWLCVSLAGTQFRNAGTWRETMRRTMSRVDNAVLKISRRRLPKSFGAFLQQNRTASSIRPRNTAMCLTTISDVTWRRLMHSWRKPRIRRRLFFFIFYRERKLLWIFQITIDCACVTHAVSLFMRREFLWIFVDSLCATHPSLSFHTEKASPNFSFFFFSFLFLRICRRLRVRDAFFKSFYTKKVHLNFVSFFYLLQKLYILSEYIFSTSLCYL